MKTLHMHALASYCQKVVIGFYELEIEFEKHHVDLGDEASRTAFHALAPLGQMPALVDDGRVFVESTIILEHAAPQLFPSLEARAADRFWDLHVHTPMQRIVGNTLRPADAKDQYGVAKWREALELAYALADRMVAKQNDTFTIADCAAAPALFFAEKIVPFGANQNLRAYFSQLSERPSVKRAFDEAAPYLHLFPGG